MRSLLGRFGSRYGGTSPRLCPRSASEPNSITQSGEASYLNRLFFFIAHLQCAAGPSREIRLDANLIRFVLTFQSNCNNEQNAKTG